jgi:hypothetical protein
MTYQKNFKPGPDFSWAVSPFLADLADLVGDQTLVISSSSSRGAALKWQWSNYLHAFFPGRFKLSLKQAQGKAFLTISLRSAVAVKLETQETILSESDDDLDDKLKAILANLEKEKAQ